MTLLLIIIWLFWWRVRVRSTQTFMDQCLNTSVQFSRTLAYYNVLIQNDTINKILIDYYILGETW